MGLFILAHRERNSIEVPDPYCTVFSAVRRSPIRELSKVFDRVDVPREGDAILIRQKGFPIHVGYCINAAYMLHADFGGGSRVERWDGIKWKNRVIGVYRYAPDRAI